MIEGTSRRPSSTAASWCETGCCRPWTNVRWWTTPSVRPTSPSDGPGSIRCCRRRRASGGGAACP